MQGRQFLKPARTLANETTEADWRGSAIHAYYALFLECREALTRWNRLPVGRQNIHATVRLKFTYAASVELKRIGTVLEHLVDLRNDASYHLGYFTEFKSAAAALTAIQDADDTIALLDAIEADPQRRAAAIASLPP